MQNSRNFDPHPYSKSIRVDYDLLAKIQVIRQQYTSTELLMMRTAQCLRTNTHINQRLLWEK